MKARCLTSLAFVLTLGIGPFVVAGQPAKVTEAFNVVEHGTGGSATTPATVGTSVHDGEYLETGVKSRAEMLLPTASITRLGANTIYNYSVETNTVDLQAGTILFCKPTEASQLNIKTRAVTAGIVGTTGFVSVQTDKAHKSTYVFGIVEGHATARTAGQSFPLGPGDILELKPGFHPLVFAFDLARFVKSSPLLTRFKGRLPNQQAIDSAVATYLDDVSRGFIQPPSHAIDYTGEIPVISTPAYDSALNSQTQPKSSPLPPPTPNRYR